MDWMLLAVAAGIPPEVGDPFVSEFRGRYLRRYKGSELFLSWRPLDLSKAYSNTYAKALYRRMVDRLREWDEGRPQDIFEKSNLVLFYLDKGDGSEAPLLKWFGTEALLVPLRLAGMDVAAGAGMTRNQRGRTVNQLANEALRQFRAREALLGLIGEEVRARDNKTCLLLPEGNFGGGINRIFAHVQRASRAGTKPERLRSELRYLEETLDSKREGGIRYFQGKGRMVFKAPSKAGARHGLSPAWNAAGHKPSCVIRGRVRFGAVYDQRFHYDCAFRRRSSRRLANCHGETVSCTGSHVNIAPNDNVRE